VEITLFLTLYYLSLSLSVIPSQGTGHRPNPLQKAPQASWIHRLFGQAMSPSVPGRVLGTGRPDAPLSLQHLCNGDK